MEAFDLHLVSDRTHTQSSAQPLWHHVVVNSSSDKVTFANRTENDSPISLLLSEYVYSTFELNSTHPACIFERRMKTQKKIALKEKKNHPMSKLQPEK